MNTKEEVVSEYDDFINTFFCLAKKIDKHGKFDIITNEHDDIDNEYSLFCNNINKTVINHCYTSLFPAIISKVSDVSRVSEKSQNIKIFPESYFTKNKNEVIKEYEIENMLREIRLLNACGNKNEEDNIDSERYIYMKYDKFKSGILTLLKFIKYKLLYIGDFGEYYLLNDKELSWNNIKELNRNDTVVQNNKLLDYMSKKYKTSHIVIYKIVLWYFRKIFVNSLIFDLVGYYKTCKDKLNDYDLDFNSVGSIKVSSDYDITLSGNNYKYISLIIGKFSSIIERIFNNSEDFVFDTNIYGVGFSKKISKKDRLDKLHYGCEITCNNTQFCITKLNIKNEKKDINDQHTWALIKLLSNLQICIKKNDIYITCNDKKSESFTNNYDYSYNCILETIIQSYNELYRNDFDLVSNIDEDYVLFLLNKADKFIKKHPKTYGFKDTDFFYGIYANLIATADKLIDKYGINNYISLVNYYGVETYYTRGAYLDVVVNQQTCKNTINMNSTKVNKDGYLDSFIENCSDFILHDFKEKYKKRALSALQNILSDNKEDAFINMKITTLTNDFDNIINDNSPFISKIINIHAFILNIFKRMQTQPDIFNYKIDYTSPTKKTFGRASTVKSYAI